MEMSPRYLAVLGWLCVLATTAHSAALSAEDTLVITRNEDEATATQKPTTDELTTEEPNPPIKMTAMEVDSVISLRYARTSVVARVRNPARRAQEAAFRVLLPDTAFISGFTMTLDGKSYKAYVKEKEEAKQIYSNAVSQGVGAAHIATKARDSNHFTVSVNVEGNASAVFNLTYEELLTRRDALYAHAVNLHPGAPVPRLAVTVRLRETQRLRRLRVPPLRTGNEVDAAGDAAQNPIATVTRSEDGREATITFEPDLEEQRRLSEIYAIKSKESQKQSQYGYRYRPDGAGSGSDQGAGGALGQFVVEYDLEAPSDGEVLVNDGYFVHFFAPTDLPPLNKHVVFVLDTSGSMSGRKIQQLQQAMRSILAELNPGDYFNIVEFSDYAKVHDINQVIAGPHSSFSERSHGATLVPPALATPENIAKAKKIIDELREGGVTNIDAALNAALQLVHRGVDRTLPSTTTPMPGATDDTKSMELQPMIIFLTDGQPNQGESNPEKIIAQVTENNSAKKKASIFSLAFGEDADRSFLRKLSLRNDGFMRHIYEAADAALQLRAFYRQVASPLLADVTFVYPPDQVKEGSLTRTKFRTVYGGSETVVAGRVAGGGAELAPRVVGVCGVRDSFVGKRCDVKPVKGQASGYLPLERLWAYLTIKQLLDERDAAADSGESDKDSNSPGKRALQLALKYEFVTPLTSLVVVKPNATSAVDAESVDATSVNDQFSVAPQVSLRSGGGVPYVVQDLIAQDPCVPSRCGPNSVCQSINGSPLCSCISTFVGSPPNCRPECASNSDCPNHRACINNKCGDPCVGDCGEMVHQVVSPTPTYVCPPGYNGDPFTRCVVKQSVKTAELSTPCTPSPCGSNTICKERNNAGSCICAQGYIGNPYEGCRPGCTVNTDCPSNKVCQQNKCQDPCPGSCAANALCQTCNHTATCTCLDGYTGNPFQDCVVLPPERPPTQGPCTPSPCGPYSVCKVINEQAVCSCKPEYGGSPPNCRPECKVSAEDPCKGQCGQNARCHVINHSPICSCLEGYNGDPFSHCTLVVLPTEAKPPKGPCVPSPCGPFSECRDIGGIPSCTCLRNYSGAPPNCRPECTFNFDCSSHLACINQKCTDPCPGSCGLNTQCIVKRNSPICSCLPHYIGDAFSECKLKGFSAPGGPMLAAAQQFPVYFRSSAPVPGTAQLFSADLSGLTDRSSFAPQYRSSNKLASGLSSFYRTDLLGSSPTHNYLPSAPALDIDESMLQATTTPRPVLARYHLDEFPWVAPLLNATDGHIAVPQTSTLLQLTEDNQAPKASGGDEACPRATDGAAGRCVYLTRCRSARAITAAQYAYLHCAVNNKYAGVCCPKDEIDVTS